MPGKKATPGSVEVINPTTFRLLILGYSRMNREHGRIWTDVDIEQAARSAAEHINKTAAKLVPEGTPMTETDLVDAVRAMIETAPVSTTKIKLAREIVKLFKSVRITS